MIRASTILILFLLASCTRDAEQSPATQARESERALAPEETPPEDAAPNFFVGRWASETAHCADLAWVITEEELRTPGEVTCYFHRIARTERGAAADATCYAEGPPQEWTLQFSYAQSARALLIENAPFNDVGLVRCEESPAEQSMSQDARAAADVVRRYYDLLAAGQYEDASRLWTPSERADAMQPARQNAEQYERYDVAVGEPGRIEGAAGSLYISIPIHIDATRKDGETTQVSAAATLRRVNNVPGATPEQLSWRIMELRVTGDE